MKISALFFLLSLSIVTTHVSGQFACQDLKQRISGSASGPSINNNAKSDTFDILHYHLELDFTTLPQRLITGKADLTITPLIAHSGVINLDLLLLQADSIMQDGQAVTYTHDDTIVAVNLLPNTKVSDTFNLTVYYGGVPIGDGSGWGGWHHANPYFFNLGVGFAADPHTYGRAWHPCFDNFVEKATYDFKVKTVKPRRPYCNGIRTSETVISGDTIETEWVMSAPIPTYLASVAISNYAEINDTVQGMQAVIPIQLMARPNDSAAAVSAFTNLKGMVHSFENSFGPYYWQKVGYATTTVGAMEHATSIHLPRTLLNPGGEDIIAHELAHHWWGDLITCETDFDMWINEGMAEYCSYLYTESVYSKQRYKDIVRNNAYRVLTQAHKNDNGYRPLYGLDHEYVYGYHVYQKGAMVAQNLRGYLGDSLFFSGLTTLLNNNKYGNLNTQEFRDQLAAITGVNLNDFFQNWIYDPGYPSIWTGDFSVNGSQVSGTVTQGLYEAPDIFVNMPVDLTFFGGTGQTETRTIIQNDTVETFSYNDLPFTPTFVTANYSSRVLTGDAYDIFSQPGALIEQYSEITLSSYGSYASDKLLSVHHWSGPGGSIPFWSDFRLSENHFWSVSFTDANDRLKGRVVVNGSTNGYDQDLLNQTGDSLAILYRPFSGGDWMLWPHQSKTMFGVPGSIQGFIEIDSLKPGDYVLANTDESIGLIETADGFPYQIYPNPADSHIVITAPIEWQGSKIVRIIDRTGRTIYSKRHEFGTEPIRIDLAEIDSKFIIVQIGKLSTKVQMH